MEQEQKRDPSEFKCATCAYFDQHGAGPRGQMSGLCMYNPPRVGSGARNGGEAYRPSTEGDDWCSKWEEGG